MQKTIILQGSARSKGNTHKIIQSLQQKISSDFIDLNTLNFSYYDYDHHNQNDDFLPLCEKLLQYDHLILATPVYWYSMSAIMKNFLDRLSDLLTIRKDMGRALKGKKLSLIICSSDVTEMEWFHKPFEETAKYLEMKYGGHLFTWVEDKQDISEEVRSRIENCLFLA